MRLAFVTVLSRTQQSSLVRQRILFCCHWATSCARGRSLQQHRVCSCKASAVCRVCVLRFEYSSSGRRVPILGEQGGLYFGVTLKLWRLILWCALTHCVLVYTHQKSVTEHTLVALSRKFLSREVCLGRGVFCFYVHNLCPFWLTVNCTLFLQNPYVTCVRYQGYAF